MIVRRRLTTLIPAVLLLVPGLLHARQAEDDALRAMFEAELPLSTFSIVACDTASGFFGVGIQSRVVAAGAIVPEARAGVGATASQAWANVAYKREAMELMAAGRSAAEVLAHFRETDPRFEDRQVAVMDAQCRVAAHTGARNTAWAGHRIGAHYSVQGNILAGQQVVDAMAEAYEAAEAEGRPFGERILAALKAGQDAGGDTRGRQGAGLLIVKEQGGYGGGDDRYADLRVEDHVEPILELERVYNVWMRLFHPADHFVPMGREPVAAPSGLHICELRRLLTAAGHDTFDGRGGSCAFDEVVIAALKAFQRAEGLPERAAVTPELAARLRAAGVRP